MSSVEACDLGNSKILLSGNETNSSKITTNRALNFHCSMASRSSHKLLHQNNPFSEWVGFELSTPFLLENSITN